MKGKRAAPSTKTSDAKATPALIREYDDDFIVNAVPIEKKSKMDVKFNDEVETIVYVKPDFVECSNRKPKRNMSRLRRKYWRAELLKKSWMTNNGYYSPSWE